MRQRVIEARDDPLVAAERLEISDEHSASSHGQPVLVLDGEAYGPDDPVPVRADVGEMSEALRARHVVFERPGTRGETVMEYLDRPSDLLDTWEDLCRRTDPRVDPRIA